MGRSQRAGSAERSLLNTPAAEATKQRSRSYSAPEEPSCPSPRTRNALQQAQQQKVRSLRCERPRAALPSVLQATAFWQPTHQPCLSVLPQILRQKAEQENSQQFHTLQQTEQTLAIVQEQIQQLSPRHRTPVASNAPRPAHTPSTAAEATKPVEKLSLEPRDEDNPQFDMWRARA